MRSQPPKRRHGSQIVLPHLAFPTALLLSPIIMAVTRRTPAALLPLLLLALLLVICCVDAAAAKKGAKSTKKSAAKASETKPAPSKKDWNKMTEEEWNAAEQDALDPEDR